MQKKIIVNKTQGVYSVFIDPMNGQSIRKDHPVAKSVVPFTMVRLADVYQHYGKENVDIIDFDPPPAQQKTVSVSDAEVNRYIATDTTIVHENSDSKMLDFFREGCVSSKYNKQYLNGMAHVVLSMYPHLKQQLIDIATKKTKLVKANNLF